MSDKIKSRKTKIKKNIRGFYRDNLFNTMGLDYNYYNNYPDSAIHNLIKEKEKAYILRHAKKLYALNIIGGVCHDCGFSHPLLLHFHHTNSMEKSDTISNIIRGNSSDNSIEALTKEAKICIPLCPNCHSEYEGDNCISKMELLCLCGHVGFCLDCGYESKNISSLVFHHIIEKDKLFGISTCYDYSSDTPKFHMPMKKILSEIAKTKIICANCHALIHSEIGRYEKLRIQIQNKALSLPNEPVKIYKNNPYKNKENKRFDRGHKPDPKGNIFGVVDNSSTNKRVINHFNDIMSELTKRDENKDDI